MIIFMAMPFMIGLMNIILPLQIGARDVAFPFLNNLSFWLTAGDNSVNVSLGLGEFAKTGWVAYPPLAGLEFSPGLASTITYGPCRYRAHCAANRHQLLSYRV